MRRVPTDLEIDALSRGGVLFISGFATSLRVERGHLVARSGEGRSIREARSSRVSRPPLRRVVIYGRGGYTTWDALEWIDGVGASFALISRDGRIVATSAEAGPNQPALRRAQVAATENEVGSAIVRELLGSKVEGQLELLRRSFTDRPVAIQTVEETSAALRATKSVNTMLALEAKAASAYWGAWGDVPIRFARADERSVPEHWLRFGERHSPLSTSGRKAVTPIGAILNYLYALAEFECRLGLLAVGLDPGLGWAHRDTPYRDSAALDLLEALRPAVDAYVLELISSRTFSRREFAELATGQVRLMPELARSLAASTLATWERLASSHAEATANTQADAAGGAVRIPGRTTRGARGKGRATLGRVGARRPTPIPSACRTCGVILGATDRLFCRECLTGFKEDRTKKLVSAARSVLERMRNSETDPAQTLEAKAKRVAAYKARKEAARAWEQVNRGPHDPETFRSEILPRLAGVTLPQMMRATELSSGYCWKIRRGERTPHPMYWAALRGLASGLA